MTLGISLLVIRRQISVATTLSWIIVVAVLPVIGTALYFIFGSHSLGRKRQMAGSEIRRRYQANFGVGKRRIDKDALPVDDFLRDQSWMVSIKTGFFPCAGNRQTLFTETGKLMDAIVSDVDAARDSLWLEFYIIAPEGKIINVLEAVERAARRGVTVRILIDDFGGRPFFKSGWPARLEAVGVQVLRSLELRLLKNISKRTDLRNHRKLIVIDQTVGYTGSFNLTDPVYFKQHLDVGEWVDVMVRLEGDIVSSLSCVFNTDYIFDRSDGEPEAKELEEATIDEVRTHIVDPSLETDAGIAMQLVPSGPEMERSVIHELIVALIYGARREVTIVTPYFVPDDTVLLALQNAAHRGVHVSIIVPEKVDSILARHAGEANFDSLMSSGIEINRYQAGMLHTKMIQIDDGLTLIGTVNMDMRSFYLNLEMTLCIYDEAFAQEAKALIRKYELGSETIDPDRWAKRGMILRWKQNIFRLMGPLL